MQDRAVGDGRAGAQVSHGGIGRPMRVPIGRAGPSANGLSAIDAQPPSATTRTQAATVDATFDGLRCCFGVIAALLLRTAAAIDGRPRLRWWSKDTAIA